VGNEGEGTLNIEDGGVVNVVGTTTLNNSTLHIELSDPTIGPFLITDGLELGGAFEISLADGFLPELGSTFDILDFNTISGSFAKMSLPALEGGLQWDTSQLLVGGTLSLAGLPPIPPDLPTKVFAVGDVSPRVITTDPWVIGALRVGNTGEGTLKITDGGVVSSSSGSVGTQSGSVGTVTVTGEGSQWNSSGRVYVGDNGTAALNIESGGVVLIVILIPIRRL